MAPANASDWRDDAREFELEVRRIAGLLFPDIHGGASVVQGAEHDGVFITENLVVVVEATTSQEKSKAEKDGRKLKALADQLSIKYRFKAIKGYFVTRTDPTAHQLDAIRRIGDPIAAISFDKFRAQLVDAKGYLDVRPDHAFGSARDPETDSVKLRDHYVALDFVDVSDYRKQYNLDAIINALEESRRVVLVGDYGAGKSMTLREVYLHFSKIYLRDRAATFCLHLNLIDHAGQTDPAEALIRHANLIGFPQPYHLVRAWKSGDAHLILDGFDEVFAPGWSAASRNLEEIRRRSVRLVKQFVINTPDTAGILIAGRQHFFDSMQELTAALGLPRDPMIASATDFTDEQVEKYLRQRQWQVALPDWLPRKPLIVGYLAARRLFDVIDEFAPDRGQGWHRLLTELCAREAKLDAGLDEATVREIVERLATLVRKTSSGLGPLNFEDLVTVFRDLRGSLPDEGAYVVLQRLPGLRVDDNKVNSRMFVDDDLVDATRAGDVYRWIQRGDAHRIPEAMYGWQNLLGGVGLAVLRCRLEENGLTVRAVQAALERTPGAPELDGLRADLLCLILLMGASPGKPVTIVNQHIPSLYISETSDASNVTLDGCMIDSLDLSDVESAEKLPTLKDCAVSVVVGVAGIDELAVGRVSGTEFITFTESAENTAAILRLDLPDHTRVALTILRKIFVQSGHSRKESALYRGLLNNKHKDLIQPVLADLEKKGAIRKTRRRDATLWEPNQAMQRRVRRILDTPTTSRDPLITGRP